MKLFLFRDTNADSEVAVNPDQVRFLRAGPSGRVTIFFDKEHSVTVEGTLEEVSSHLKSGSTG